MTLSPECDPGSNDSVEFSMPEGVDAQQEFIVKTFGKRAITGAAREVCRTATLRDVIGSDRDDERIAEQARQHSEASKRRRRFKTRNPFRPR